MLCNYLRLSVVTLADWLTSPKVRLSAVQASLVTCLGGYSFVISLASKAPNNRLVDYLAIELSRDYPRGDNLDYVGLQPQ